MGVERPYLLRYVDKHSGEPVVPIDVDSVPGSRGRCVASHPITPEDAEQIMRAMPSSANDYTDAINDLISNAASVIASHLILPKLDKVRLALM